MLSKLLGVISMGFDMADHCIH